MVVRAVDGLIGAVRCDGCDWWLACERPCLSLCTPLLRPNLQRTEFMLPHQYRSVSVELSLVKTKVVDLERCRNEVEAQQQTATAALSCVLAHWSQVRTVDATACDPLWAETDRRWYPLYCYCGAWQLEADVKTLLATVAAGAPSELRPELDAVVASAPSPSHEATVPAPAGASNLTGAFT